MRHTDIAIVGGGLAGSTTAAMLARAGYGVVLIDPHPVYPSDFRCEKLDGPQARILQKTGLADAVMRVATHDRECWVARFDRVVDRRAGDQYGVMYDTLVNAMRAEVPASSLLAGKALDVATGYDRQIVKLADGEEVSARLIVMANGLNSGLRQRLGFAREDLSKAHSIAIGFDLKPVGRPAFPIPALTYYCSRPRDRTAYITLFPIGPVMRANLMTYRDLHDPWLQQLRAAPEQTLLALLPALRDIMGDFEVDGRIQIRPADLYVTRGCNRAGIVLAGDAYATSCPAAGTGAGKVLNDVERLCNVHIPRWFATPGMGEDKIAAFYSDPVKQAYDQFSQQKAFELRAQTLGTGLAARARHRLKFLAHYGVGAFRQVRRRLTVKIPGPQPVTGSAGPLSPVRQSHSGRTSQ
jgi:2-polyprenyl-6-methoxyphenol hydroxylase-like FAD-dependent oxidoreductase